MINQEEYEILKGLDDKWKWIARHGVKNKLSVYELRPIKSAFVEWWFTNKWYGCSKIVPIDLFQFIQWEDEEPYRISDLIKEYEDRGDIGYTLEEYAEYIIKFSEKLLTKLEDEKMKKDKEWAKEEIKELMTEESQNYPQDEMVEKEIVLGILNQLDEPEKPVVPKFVANLIKVLKADEELTSVSDALYYGAKDDEEESVTDWRDENVDKFAKAWLDYPDIEIEEEPKYYVLDKEDRPLLLRFSQGIMRAPSGLSPLDEIVKNQRNSMQFTEQEIKDCDERFWAFAVPVEEVENERYN